MKRQTIDQEGARQGEVSAASIQMGNDTIAVRRIATMSVEKHDFFPWDTPENRKTQSIYATSCVGFLFFALVALAIGYVSGKQPHAVYAVLGGWFLLLVGLFLGVRAMMIALKLKKMEPYYRLLIGTSDGRQIPLVDNNRDVLIKIRDVVLHKMDTGDASVTGDFDLNLDIVNLRLPKGAAAPAQPARARPSDVFDEEEDAPPAGS
ncbi:MAG: hypothetical protein IPK75_07025 [Acidobacteria bacterium]|nr:hypothetical protein [Acidobacteriota bacterium]